MLQRVMPRFSAEIFLSQSTELFRRGTRNTSVLCFIKFLLPKKFMDKKGGVRGLSKFPVENFLSQNAGKFRKGTLQSFNKFGYRKTIPFRGLCHDFLSRKFLSHSAEKIRKGPSCAVFQKNSGSENVFG